MCCETATSPPARQPAHFVTAKKKNFWNSDFRWNPSIEAWNGLGHRFVVDCFVRLFVLDSSSQGANFEVCMNSVVVVGVNVVVIEIVKEVCGAKHKRAPSTSSKSTSSKENRKTRFDKMATGCWRYLTNRCKTLFLLSTVWYFSRKWKYEDDEWKLKSLSPSLCLYCVKVIQFSIYLDVLLRYIYCLHVSLSSSHSCEWRRSSV